MNRKCGNCEFHQPFNLGICCTNTINVCSKDTKHCQNSKDNDEYVCEEHLFIPDIEANRIQYPARFIDRNERETEMDNFEIGVDAFL